ncbi:MAG: NUDIX hydrolase [Acidimicrobiales bacterium]|nr:NUDIX hydrolase [Acidimicrobiales bacterium]
MTRNWLAFCSNCAEPIDAAAPVQCAACAQWHYANPRPCAGALVERDGKVLLLKRAFEPWFGHWDIPGGFVEDGEHPAVGARREVLEETGLDVELVGLLGMWMDTYGDDARALTTLNVYYLATAAPDAVLTIDAAEADDHGWFGPEDPIEPLGFPTHFPGVLQRWRDVCEGIVELGPVDG